MKFTPNDYSGWSQNSSWLPDTLVSETRIAEKLRPLVTDRGSLTRALKAIDDASFAVNVLSEKISRAYPHEQIKLHRDPQDDVLIREVELFVHAKAVVYARSIIPLSLLQDDTSGLVGLGSTPLGQLLFTDGNIRVSKREYLFFEHNNRQQVARRTPYDYRTNTILVSEFFLPAIYDIV